MTAIQLGMPKVVHYGEGNIFEETPFPKYAKEELKNEHATRQPALRDPRDP